MLSGDLMATKKVKTSSNGHMPTAKDFPAPKKLTPEMRELREATREAMEALRSEIEKYGRKPDFRH